MASLEDYERWQERLAREAVPAPFGRGSLLVQTHVQWKGTKLCLDFICACGFQGHVDDYFCYVLECSECGRKYEVASWLCLRPMTTNDELDFRPILVTDDD